MIIEFVMPIANAGELQIGIGNLKVNLEWRRLKAQATYAYSISNDNAQSQDVT